jgi:hypothetical protein
LESTEPALSFGLYQSAKAGCYASTICVLNRRLSCHQKPKRIRHARE